MATIAALRVARAAFECGNRKPSRNGRRREESRRVAATVRTRGNRRIMINTDPKFTGRLAKYSSHDEYNADTSRVRSTQLKDMVSPQGPRSYYLKYVLALADIDRNDRHSDFQPKITDLEMGTLLHEYALEGVQNWFVCDERRGSDAWYDSIDEHDGKWAIKPRQAEQLVAWRDSMMRNKEVRDLIESKSFQEQAFQFTHNETGIECKSRVDLFGFDGTIWDLKTTRHLSRDDYDRQVINLNYPFSAAFYEAGRNSVPEFSGMRAPFKHIVLCKSHPYYCYIWPVDRSYLRVGHQEVQKALFRLKSCLDQQQEVNNPEDAWPDLQELKQGDSVTAPEWWLSKKGWEDYECV